MTTELAGTVFYLERIALPPHAEIEVALGERSGPESSPRLVARLTWDSNGAQVPIPFVLPLASGAIDVGQTYALQAEIRVDGRVAFRSAEEVPVVTRGERSTGIEIRVNTHVPRPDGELPA